MWTSLAPVRSTTWATLPARRPPETRTVIRSHLGRAGVAPGGQHPVIAQGNKLLQGPPLVGHLVKGPVEGQRGWPRGLAQGVGGSRVHLAVIPQRPHHQSQFHRGPVPQGEQRGHGPEHLPHLLWGVDEAAGAGADQDLQAPVRGVGQALAHQPQGRGEPAAGQVLAQLDPPRPAPARRATRTP